MQKNKSKSKAVGPVWNLKLLYSSPSDPQIEKDIAAFEKMANSFAQTYDNDQKAYLSDPTELLKALTDYEKNIREAEKKFGLYFFFMRDIDASNTEVAAAISRLEDRMTKLDNKLSFFSISLGQIPAEQQEKFLNDPSLKKYKVFLSRIFSDAKHQLSVAEEKIMNLKSMPAYNMWVAGNERVLNMKTVTWGEKILPLPEAMGTLSKLDKASQRKTLAAAIAKTLKEVAPFSEAEINAIMTNKKINDELRGYTTPYENTVQGYRNDPEVVKTLVDTVTKNFAISHRFFKLKARLLKLKKLSYSDRNAKIGSIKTKFTFEESAKLLKEIFGKLNPKLPQLLETYIKEGRVDAFPRVGKKGGAYCWGSYSCPTFVLLNHTDDFRSFTTFAHEFGHAFHTEFSRPLGAIYYQYSTSLAETASTLFESIAAEAVYEKLSPKEKIVALHNMINDDIQTIFRQIACFNFENDIHQTVRSKGFVPAAELASLHNKNMGAYLGPNFKMEFDDGYFFVQWSHIRRFFYVYSYAYGQLVTKALLRRLKADPKFWSSIEKFLSSGGKDSPENILKEIGIDVSLPGFWLEGLKEIEDNIAQLEKLTK